MITQERDGAATDRGLVKRCVELLSHIPDGLAPTSDTFRQHVVGLGSEETEQKLVRVEQADRKEEGSDELRPSVRQGPALCP